MTTTVQTPVKANRRDVHQQVTDKIIQQMEAGTIPWQQPWKQGEAVRSLSIPKNLTTGKKYRGVNILLLWLTAEMQQYPTNEWASFMQWQDKKEAVRKGEKGTMIVYYDTIKREEDGEEKIIPFLKTSFVFNKAQLANYEPKPVENDGKPLANLVQRIEKANVFVDNTGAIIQHKEPKAYYNRLGDFINMPPPELFFDLPTCTATESYYSTLLHELTHWSGDKKRLNREKGKKFGDTKYAAEELVAELGAAFLCAELEISQSPPEDHAAYLQSWLKALKDDKHLILTAASEASKAVDYLQGLQPTS
ncbi:zincin-like metallopeptidase domain-containing protein [Flavitalea sp. BT771]|uniref:ArdC family protein n=1 Tax=Flavitalea sp. BT771 TaxID=3063329 RepID=UPI0026E3D880|nr:zincin-like metallopeptidase domain-containing protein [Flavitalea sp. BT771]MDO6430901.1 zincin-like metallopeptidase domain-containing protein [Flavitalea sp. BT771]MDV6218959.1 zincin-like metallopeptidase domain-containing protein [Flavitalea sp. BT771]